jgi:eukaryotic-like serine/threonine-protein kinase
VSADEATPPDEQGAAWLAAYDQALAQGATPADAGAALPPELQPRLQRDAAFLRLLEEVWPRHTPTAPPAPDGAAPGLPAELGRFQIRRELGRGGYGVVLLAYDPQLRRDVALKVPKADALLEPESRKRFLREARAAAALDHPHLVPVYEAGEAGALCYLASAYCPGPTLAEWLRGQAEPVPTRDAAALVALLAEAVEHAHQRGVVHRDLKPGNVLLAAGGSASLAKPSAAAWTPKITDFGLAKQFGAGPDGSGRASMTQSGAIVGTPCYMAPEQAAGHSARVGPAADVYALGVILYELLAGRPPFMAETPLETLLQVQGDEPVPPGRLRGRLPRDLETICLKCLHKEPRQRYGSAQELADDLRRFLAGEPVRARPVSALGRLGRWCRRKPAWAALSLVSAAAVALAVAGAVGFALYQAEANRKLTSAYTDLSTKNTDLINAEKARRRFTRLSAILAFDQALERCEKGQTAEGVRLLATALEICPPDEEHLAAVIRTNLDGWGARLSPVTALLPHGAEVSVVAFSPDGNTILTACWDGKARLWDAATGRLVHLLDHGDKVVGAAFSPDGKRVLTGGSGLRAVLWDADTGRPVGGEPLPQTSEVTAVAYSPDGKTVATAAGEEVVRLWDVAAERPVLRHELPPGTEILALAFSPDGTRLLAGGMDGKGRMWDVAAGKPWTGAAGKDWNTPRLAQINAVAFSPDGKRFVTGTNDGAIRLLDTATGRDMGLVFSGSRSSALAVAFSSDGGKVLTGGATGGVILLDAAHLTPLAKPLPHSGSVRGVAFSPDGQRLLTGCSDGTARVWQLRTDEPTSPVLVHDGMVWAVAFSPDGRTILTASRDGKARLWDVATGKLRGDPLDLPLMMPLVAFSPDGKMFVTAGEDKQVRRWDTATNQPVGAPLPHQDRIWAVAFSPDGRTLASCAGGAVRRWDPVTGEERGPPLVHSAGVQAVAFSPDGQTLLTGGGGMARFWEAATGQLRPLTLPRQGALRAVAFTPDGKAVLTVGATRVSRWDAATGVPLEPAVEAPSIVLGMALSPDGQTLLTGGTSVRLWDLATGKQLGPPLGNSTSVSSLAFSPDGKHVLTGSSDGKARLWPVPIPMGGTVEEVVRRARLSTLLEQDENGALRPIDPHTWQELRRQPGPAEPASPR